MLHFKDDSSSFIFTKEIFVSNKNIDLPSTKIIFKKQLWAYETFSSSYLGSCSYIKSKVKAATHVKLSFNTSFKSSDSAYSSDSTSYTNMSLFSNYASKWLSISHLFQLNSLLPNWCSTFILSTLNILHRLLDKEKPNLYSFILKELLSRSILLWFNSRIFEMCVSYNL